MYTVFKKDFCIETLPKSEILRYMRVGKSQTDVFEGLVNKAINSVLVNAGCRTCFVRLPVEIISEERLNIGEMNITSLNLCKRLSLCDEAFVFCATVGVGVDRVIRQAEVTSPLLSLACDATGSTLVEELCDKLNAYLTDTVIAEGKSTVERFSAGYGDFSIEWQRKITEILNTPKNIGASLTNGLMMSPTKTVTAVVGIKKV